MVDEKLDDQVWVTVVATGYGEQRARRAARDELGAAGIRTELREPAGEPRVARTSALRRRSARVPRASWTCPSSFRADSAPPEPAIFPAVTERTAGS